MKHARNTLENPDAVKPEEARIVVEGGRARFVLPRWSVGVATLRRP